MVWFIKTWKNTTWFTGILSSEHLQLCFRTAGAYFVFVSRQIKEEFKVQSKSQSPPPRDSDDSPPPLHPDKLSASCPPFWHCKQSLSDLAEACKCAPSRCAHGLRRSARSWWTSPAAHTQTHSLVPFLPHLPWSQGPAATQPLDSLAIECSLYPSSRLLTHHTFSIISRCRHRCMAATASLSIISAVTFHPSPWYSLTTIRCFVYLWPLALQWRELWTRLQSLTGWLRPHCHYSWLVQQDLEWHGKRAFWTVWSFKKPIRYALAVKEVGVSRDTWNLLCWGVGGGGVSWSCNWSGIDNRDSGVCSTRKGVGVQGRVRHREHTR